MSTAFFDVQAAVADILNGPPAETAETAEARTQAGCGFSNFSNFSKPCAENPDSPPSRRSDWRRIGTAKHPKGGEPGTLVQHSSGRYALDVGPYLLTIPQDWASGLEHTTPQ